jgi:hypothetical protein
MYEMLFRTCHLIWLDDSLAGFNLRKNPISTGIRGVVSLENLKNSFTSEEDELLKTHGLLYMLVKTARKP